MVGTVLGTIGVKLQSSKGQSPYKLDKQNLVKTRAVISVFNKSYSVYGSRKIKAVLCKQNIIISRRKIRLIMQEYGLISKYTSAKYKINISKVNEEKTNNLLNRNFNNKGLGEVIVSDLTYVRVGNVWNYICLIIDLFNREIIGHSVGSNKDAKLVNEALLSVTRPLKNTKLFHTDRGSEFKNYKIAETLQFFNITRSLSKKGCHYDNAVAEATYKIFKTELINDQKFNSSWIII